MATIDYAPRMPFNFDPDTAEYVAVRVFEVGGKTYKLGDPFTDPQDVPYSIPIAHAYWKAFNLGEKNDPWTDEAIERSKNEQDILAFAVKQETIDKSHALRGWGGVDTDPIKKADKKTSLKQKPEEVMDEVEAKEVEGVEEVDFNEMTRAELVDIAKAKGVKVTKNDNKSAVIDLIMEAMNDEQSDT